MSKKKTVTIVRDDVEAEVLPSSVDAYKRHGFDVKEEPKDEESGDENVDTKDESAQSPANQPKDESASHQAPAAALTRGETGTSRTTIKDKE